MTVITCLSPYSEQQVRELAGSWADEVEIRLLPEPPAVEALHRAVVDADIIIGDIRGEHRVDREVLALARSCRLVQQPAVGFDSIDAQAAAELGIPVSNAGPYNLDSVADWVLMAILNLVRNGAVRDRSMHEGGWERDFERAHDLSALTVGIVGFGNIGRAVARRLGGFGSTVVYFDPVAPAGADGAESLSLEELLQRSDVITVHAPLTPATRHLIDAEKLRLLRPGALLVNASRGPLIDEEALVEALRRGGLGGAALDVFEVEPLAADSPLRGFDNVFLTPHVAGDSTESRNRLVEVVAENIQRVLAGLPPEHVVNRVSPGTTGTNAGVDAGTNERAVR